jgi:PAS domain S-box-containing protein
MLTLLLLIGLWTIHNVVLPHTRERDLNRIGLYARFSKLLLDTDAAAGRSAEETLAKIHRLGLTNAELLPLSEAPSTDQTRIALPMGLVEATEVFKGADGQPAGVVRFRRWDDTTRLALDSARVFVTFVFLGGLLLIVFTWWSLTAPASRKLQALAERLRRDFGLVDGDDGKRATHPLSTLENLIGQATAQTLRAAELRQRLLDGHQEAACTGTPDGTLQEVNAAYCRIFNKTREELVGSNYLDLIPPTDRSEVLNSLRRLSSRHPVNIVEHRVVLPDGTMRWMRWRDQAVLDDDGNVLEVLSFGTDITSEKLLEDRMAGLQLAFDQMQSLAETGSLTWDFAADRMDWTPETRRLLGVEASAPASIENLLAIVAPDERETIRRLFQEAREQGRNFQQEFRAVLPDGSLRFLQSRAEVLADPKTKLLNNLTCTLRDITALRDAEAATKRELRLREAIEQSLAVGIVVRDMSGRTLSANPAFTAMVGFTEEELLNAAPPAEPYWPEKNQQTISAALASALDGRSPKEGFQLVFRRKDGSLFDALVSVAPLLGEDGKPRALLGAVTDISAIQRTRRDLQTTNERLRIAQDVAEFGIWDWDPVRDTLHWDRQSFALFGYPEATDPQETWAKVHSEEEQERLTYELKRLIATGGTSGQDRIRVRWPDGTVHDILSTYVILRDETGRGTRVLGINRDITTELEEERELHLANERLAAALEGGQFGTFEHVIGLGDINWSPANYEINGIDPSVTDPTELFELWRQNTGAFFPELMARMNDLPVSENQLTYEFTAQPPGLKPRRIRTSVFIERNKRGHPVRLVGITRRMD